MMVEDFRVDLGHSRPYMGHGVKAASDQGGDCPDQGGSTGACLLPSGQV
jgi:hypothetical protein